LYLCASDDIINERVTEEHNKQNNLKFVKEVSDSTPFMLGFHGNIDVEIIQKLLEYKININSHDYNGNNILHIAAFKNNLNVIK